MLTTRLRILLAEDEPWIAIFLKELLEDMGHDVLPVETTEDGVVTAATRDKPDLMIVDNNLKTGSGTDAVKTILKTGFIPHIFTTGDTLADVWTHPGAVVLRKPFRDNDLTAAIERAMHMTRDAA